MTMPLDQFHSSTFREQLHTRFKISADDVPAVEFELAEVDEPKAPAHVELFTLIFRGPRAPVLPQKIYRVEHATLGGFDLFLTAVAADQQGTAYEAVINRVRKTS